jgi:hypothetical protein
MTEREEVAKVLHAALGAGGYPWDRLEAWHRKDLCRIARAVLARLNEMGWTPPALTLGDASEEDLRRPPPDTPGG